MKDRIKNSLLNLKSEIWPLAIVVTGLLLSASITFASLSFATRREVVIERPAETKAVLGIEASASASPSAAPSELPSPSVNYIYKAASTPKPSAIASATPSPVSAPPATSQTAAPIIIQIIATPAPTPTPSPSENPSATPEPSPPPAAETVSIEIKQPDSTLNFDLPIDNGMNVCQAMQKAKDQGKINSISISDKYLESFGTLFVEEINGFKNNWVFTVNGESPNGCSLITLKNGDKVVWEFLSL